MKSKKKIDKYQKNFKDYNRDKGADIAMMVATLKEPNNVRRLRESNEMLDGHREQLKTRKNYNALGQLLDKQYAFIFVHSDIENKKKKELLKFADSLL